MNIDYTLNINTLVDLAIIVIGGIVTLATLKRDIKELKESDDARGEQLAGVQTELKKLTDILTRQAVLDTRLAAAEQDIRDMQRGRGFIQGSRNLGGVDGEYP